jgi:hypothetical protein
MEGRVIVPAFAAPIDQRAFWHTKMVNGIANGLELVENPRESFVREKQAPPGYGVLNIARPGGLAGPRSNPKPRAAKAFGKKITREIQFRKTEQMVRGILLA